MRDSFKKVLYLPKLPYRYRWTQAWADWPQVFKQWGNGLLFLKRHKISLCWIARPLNTDISLCLLHCFFLLRLDWTQMEHEVSNGNVTDDDKLDVRIKQINLWTPPGSVSLEGGNPVIRWAAHVVFAFPSPSQTTFHPGRGSYGLLN